MAPESKPPMRQIAELIDGIATARAESAETLLAACEVQLIEARFGEKTALETIADRDAQIERVKALLDSALSDCIDRDAEIARLKAALDTEEALRQCREEQLRLLHDDYAGCVKERDAAIVERNDARAEVETWQREYSGALADFEHAQAEIARLKAELEQAHAELSGFQCALLTTPEQRGGYATAAAPPAEDPRVDALCYLVAGLDDVQQIPRTHHAESKSLAAYRLIAPEDAAFWAERRVRR